MNTTQNDTLGGAKLWQKTTVVAEEIDRFTVGNDRVLDLMLAPYDVMGSMAHVTMLASVGLLTEADPQIHADNLANVFYTIEI